MKVVDLLQAKGSLADYVHDAATDPIIVTDGGTPVAALVPIENTDLETATLATNPAFLALLERSRSRLRDEGAVSMEEMKRRFATP
jgi:prevent-host-death family protein